MGIWWRIAAALVVVAGVAAALYVTGVVRPGPSVADRERAATLVAEARTRIEAGDQDAALRALDEAIALAPAGDALQLRASIRIGRGDFDGALEDVDRQIRGGERSAAAYSQRCWLRARGENLTAARADCDRAIELDPALASGYGNRGLVGLRQGRNPEAWADFNTAMRVGGQDNWVAWRLFGRGVAAWRRGDHMDAREDIENVLRSDPSVPAQFAQFGIGAEVMRNFEEAAYQSAMRAPSVTTLSQYLAIYPSGAHADAARAQMAEISARVEAEEAAGRRTIPGFRLTTARGAGAADSFGAIAISRSSGRVAFSTDYDHPQTAMLAAQRSCNAGGVPDCDAFAFRNVCAALALSPERQRGMAWSYARDDALDAAIGQCRSRGGRACVAVHSRCTPTAP